MGTALRAFARRTLATLTTLPSLIIGLIRDRLPALRMEMRTEWIKALIGWASDNNNILALWLFGSRAKGISKPDSDIDIALELMPPIGKDNYALAAYIQFFDDWKAQLGQVLSWRISLVAIGPNTDLDEEVRKTGVIIWRRTPLDGDAHERL